MKFFLIMILGALPTFAQDECTYGVKINGVLFNSETNTEVNKSSLKVQDSGEPEILSFKLERKRYYQGSSTWSSLRSLFYPEHTVTQNVLIQNQTVQTQHLRVLFQDEDFNSTEMIPLSSRKYSENYIQLLHKTDGPQFQSEYSIFPKLLSGSENWEIRVSMRNIADKNYTYKKSLYSAVIDLQDLENMNLNNEDFNNCEFSHIDDETKAKLLKSDETEEEYEIITKMDNKTFSDVSLSIHVLKQCSSK